MSMYCEIRKLKKSETGLLERFLYLAIFVPEGTEPPPYDIVKKPELRVYTDGFYEDEADMAFLAVKDGRPIGAAWARIMDDYGHIDDNTPSLAVSVVEGHRGKGTGTALLTALINELREQGYGRVSLSVQKANRAFGLYKRLGFVTVREDEEEAVMARYL